MNRAEYRQARRMCRANGRHALGWMTREHAAVMEASLFSRTTDHLAERARCYRRLGWGIHLAKSLAVSANTKTG